MWSAGAIRPVLHRATLPCPEATSRSERGCPRAPTERLLAALPLLLALGIGPRADELIRPLRRKSHRVLALALGSIGGAVVTCRLGSSDAGLLVSRRGAPRLAYPRLFGGRSTRPLVRAAWVAFPLQTGLGVARNCPSKRCLPLSSRLLRACRSASLDAGPGVRRGQYLISRIARPITRSAPSLLTSRSRGAPRPRGDPNGLFSRRLKLTQRIADSRLVDRAPTSSRVIRETAASHRVQRSSRPRARRLALPPP